MADYTKTTWIDDDGSTTVGTALNATRLNNLESGVQDAAQHNKTGTLASRPAAASGNKGWLYYATDTGTFALSDGSTWQAQPVPQCRVYHNTTQSFTSGSDGPVQFNTEVFDLGTPSTNMHDTVTNNSRITCRVAGTYTLSGMWSWAAGASSNRNGEFRVNGGIIPGAGMVTVTASVGAVAASISYRLAVNDYVEMYFYQNTGGALVSLADGTYNQSFQAIWISP